ncbi:Eco57I restriction-modification methylase domain-containing protein [Allocoleopsis sp.]|uniref:Eco57I restriction-modification methylase domain-containing protein n=1 Tax=Allocoleopsis sp. TaxID=3088169 RepID=UPI002FD1E2E9
MSAVATTLIGVQIEGNLIAPDMTTDLLAGEIKGQTPEDFNFAKTDKLADEIAIAWGDAKAYWTAFQRRLARLDADDMATSLTREQWAVPLLESLGYSPVYTAKAEIVDGQTYAISHRAEAGENKPPIHIVGCRVKLEQRPPSGTPRLSAHTLMQEYLNRTEHLWGIVTNGLQWRLLRDSSLMSRPTYIEFDLEQILNGENFAEFGLFYRLFHRSRLPQGMDDADECLLEYYHQEAIQQGGRVRDRLRDGVEKALVLLGTGFLQHPANQQLRQQFESGELTDKVYYRQLLLLIYRLLFLMVAESRDLLLADEDPEKARIYKEYYSVSRLRNIAERRSYRREGFQDLWQGLRVTFRLFDENWRGEALKLSPLNGDLFGSKTLQDLDACAIDNHDLLLAIRELSLYVAVPTAASRRVQQGQLRRVNYEALDVEELGSVYESLLDFHPQVVQRQGIYEFALVLGSDRKTTGSYYTPPELVGQLIKSALEPVIADKLKGTKTPAEQEAALLSLKVCDPACGSGHFLLAAARRIGKELAKVRTGEAQPGPKPLSKAIRDAIQNCIYGVDLNPLAVDLCKVALWIEGFNRGFPLNFLDHRIKCGNSLVGVLDLDCLKEGIPDEAFKAVTGDDKTLSSQFKKRNKKERETDNKGQLSIFVDQLDESRSQYAQTLRQVGAIDEKTTGQYREKATQYYQSRQDSGWWRDYSACNLWTAAFFMPLTEQNLQLLPTTAALTQLLQGNLSTQKVVEAANKLAQEKRFFHWYLEFPEVFEQGGFDYVLGNPPWERIKLEEKEFFASRSAEIANAANKAAREKLIKQLPQTNSVLAQAWAEAKHDAEAQSKFLRESGRFPLTAVGDINTYAVFTETTRNLISPNGRAGVIVPSGIATDDNCKKFFGDLVKSCSLKNITGFRNLKFIFSGIHDSVKFCILSMGGIAYNFSEMNFTWLAHTIQEANNPKKEVTLTSSDFLLINPNTLTCPVFRSNADAELTKKIYHRVPVLENEHTGSSPWNIFYIRLVHLGDHADRLKFPWTERESRWNIPLYEAKLMWFYDHRFATFTDISKEGIVQGKAKEVSDECKKKTDFKIEPRYFLHEDFVQSLFAKYPEYKRNWFLVWRDITNNTNERTCIATAIPKLAASVSLPVLGFSSRVNPSVLIGNLNSIVLDYIVRQKIGGTHLSFSILKQLPIIPPERYTSFNIEFINSRVLELVYTAWDMQPFAQDMGYDGEPFIWDSQRRALLRAELDAYYAKLYGLTRDELRYILDPADIYGSDFPSETFRVLKNNEIKQFGEYRTQRLVLEAWDRMFGR